MKSPVDLAPRWARQWENPTLREARLIDEAVWPVSLPIGRPSGSTIASSWQEVANHIRLWREVRVGTVRWEAVVYRATGAPVDIPISWELSNLDEWISAANDRAVRLEYNDLCRILANVDPMFHSVLIRERSLWRSKTPEETIQASKLVLQLNPGCADGKPLRLLPLAGIDSKFFERHRNLITRLLDLRFDGEVIHQGLETFLDAWCESDHWLLLADLGHAPSLPFAQLRVRASELATARLSVRALIVVENEKCLHLLPRDLIGVVAILGTGNNLAWLRSEWAQTIPIAYWGDLDTWGLTLLARARDYAPNIVPILMTREAYDDHSRLAVPEKIPASMLAPSKLSSAENSLYYYLLTNANGRLEQEFLPLDLVHSSFYEWWTRSQFLEETSTSKSG